MSRFDELRAGDVVVGQVTGVAPFGAFVRIADDAEGLLPGESRLEPGSRVTVRITELDRVRRRAELTRA